MADTVYRIYRAGSDALKTRMNEENTVYTTSVSQDNLRKKLPVSTRPDTPRPDEATRYSLGQRLFASAEQKPVHVQIQSVISTSKSLEFSAGKYYSNDELNAFLKLRDNKTPSPLTIKKGYSPQTAVSSELDDLVDIELQGLTI